MNKSSLNHSHRKRLWAVIFFVAGNAVGAGVLGIPVALGDAGLGRSLLGCFAVYVPMVISGQLLSQLFLENRNDDLPGLFRLGLGNWGKRFFSFCYFTLFFCLLIAYWAGLNRLFQTFLPFSLLWLFVLIVITTTSLHVGFRAMSLWNSLLTLGMAATFFGLIGHALFVPESAVEWAGNWGTLNDALPILLCSYGFHGAIPLICKQLDFNPALVKKAIFGGSLFPLIFNCTIVILSFHLLSKEELRRGLAEGLPVFILFKSKFLSPGFLICGEFFSFFAILSSLFGVTLTISGALREIWKHHSHFDRRWETLLLIIFPVAIAVSCPGIFLKTLSLAGGIFLNLIAGILPISIYINRGQCNWWICGILLFFIHMFVGEVVSIFQ